jgi:hypothetical protein
MGGAMTEQDAIKIYEQKGIYDISRNELEEIATTFASVLRALREENVALRTSLGEAQGLLASRHFPRPLI